MKHLKKIYIITLDVYSFHYITFYFNQEYLYFALLISIYTNIGNFYLMNFLRMHKYIRQKDRKKNSKHKKQIKNNYRK